MDRQTHTNTIKVKNCKYHVNNRNYPKRAKKKKESQITEKTFVKATFDWGLKNMQNLSGENIRKWWHCKQR